MDFHRLLGLGDTASPQELKARYYQRLAAVHPNSRAGGDTASFIRLQEAYKKYLLGDDFSNCFLVCTADTKGIACRCGGIYGASDGSVGRIDCDYCSCFIQIEEPPKEIAGGGAK